VTTWDSRLTLNWFSGGSHEVATCPGVKSAFQLETCCDSPDDASKTIATKDLIPTAFDRIKAAGKLQCHRSVTETWKMITLLSNMTIAEFNAIADPNKPPLEDFIVIEGKVQGGIDIEVCRMVAAAMNVEPVFQWEVNPSYWTSWYSGFNDLSAGTLDLFTAHVSYQLMREGLTDSISAFTELFDTMGMYVHPTAPLYAKFTDEADFRAHVKASDLSAGDKICMKSDGKAPQVVLASFLAMSGLTYGSEVSTSSPASDFIRDYIVRTAYGSGDNVFFESYQQVAPRFVTGATPPAGATCLGYTYKDGSPMCSNTKYACNILVDQDAFIETLKKQPGFAAGGWKKNLGVEEKGVWIKDDDPRFFKTVRHVQNVVLAAREFEPPVSKNDCYSDHDGILRLPAHPRFARFKGDLYMPYLGDGWAERVICKLGNHEEIMQRSNIDMDQSNAAKLLGYATYGTWGASYGTLLDGEEFSLAYINSVHGKMQSSPPLVS
jgi:hypothetical protein